MNKHDRLYGVLARFADADSLVTAARRVTDDGYRRTDAFSPFPLEDLPEAMRMGRTRVPLVVLIGGLLGAIGGFGMLYYACKISYPINVGGRPLNSWPAFIPITFEMTVLFAGLAAVFGMLALNGLPMPYHPVFNVKSFECASSDGFFLLIEKDDERFELANTSELLRSVGAVSVHEVPV